MGREDIVTIYNGHVNTKDGVAIVFGDDNNIVKELEVGDRTFVYKGYSTYYGVVVIVGKKRLDGITDIFSCHYLEYAILRLYNIQP